jgi:hypothetical protein
MPITINGSGTITGVSVGGLPDGIVDSDMLASGAITATGLPTGSVLQAVHTVYATQAANTTTTLADTGLSLSITPVAANSNILVIVSQRIQCYRNSVDSSYSNFYILRGSTILEDDNAQGVGYFGVYSNTSGVMQLYGLLPMQILDDPTYTLGDTITYKTQHRPNTTAGGGQSIAQSNSKQSRMTLLEIAG